MRKRLVTLGLLAAVSQLFSTGCLFHPVARWRANHPYFPCATCGPLEVRRPLMLRYPPLEAPVGPPCHGCGDSVGVPVGYGGGPGGVVPVTNPPTIGYPMPIAPGPTVVPSYELHSPMPMSKSGSN
jgi:hypothetical protein